MTTESAPAPERTDLDVGSSLLHGVHFECQRDRPKAMTVCCLLVPWEDFSPDSTGDECIVCWTMPSRCRVCGVSLSRTPS